MDGPGRWSPGGVSTQQNPGHKTASGGPVMDTLGGQEGREGELGLGGGSALVAAAWLLQAGKQPHGAATASVGLAGFGGH